MVGFSPARRRLAVDVAIAVAVTAVALCLVSRTGWHAHQDVRPGLLGYLLVAAGGVVLLARRVYPVAVLAVTLAAALWAARLAPGRRGSP